ncbi:hypothetical protein B0H14DRAFT_1513687 [Mycena olivaceomarginata]|nr:hypothetical protein B0H14DRAFT_1513687 [Mycena olivaceomarginata]
MTRTGTSSSSARIRSPARAPSLRTDPSRKAPAIFPRGSLRRARVGIVRPPRPPHPHRPARPAPRPQLRLRPRAPHPQLHRKPRAPRCRPLRRAQTQPHLPPPSPPPASSTPAASVSAPAEITTPAVVDPPARNPGRHGDGGRARAVGCRELGVEFRCG